MTINPKKFQFVPFAICLLIALAVGAIGSLFTFESVTNWYKTINKPSFTPPDAVFGPVWTTLFILMGIASYLVWKRRKMASGYAWAASIYFLQLFFNMLWSYLFFDQHQIGLAVIEVLVFLATIIINAFLFYRINKIAGLLLIPYIIWVAFASYLTYSIFILN
jgi:benzodiazapine receptor